MRRTCASRFERKYTTFGVCKKTTASPGKRSTDGTPPSQHRESSTNGTPPAITLSFAMSISFLAQGFRIGLVVSATWFCSPNLFLKPGLSTIGPGPVSPSTFRESTPLDKTQVLLFEEKSGMASL